MKTARNPEREKRGLFLMGNSIIEDTGHGNFLASERILVR
jgi:hypothetical protein